MSISKSNLTVLIAHSPRSPTVVTCNLRVEFTLLDRWHTRGHTALLQVWPSSRSTYTI